MQYHNISTAEEVGALIEHITMAYKLALVCVRVGSLEIVLCCHNLESLEHLWSDYLAGHLNELAERYLVTDEVRGRLSLETGILTTITEQEDYSICKKALMEMAGEFSASLTKFFKG